MNIRTMAWVLGGTFVLALGGVGVVACSSNDNGGVPSGNGNNTTDASVHNDSGSGSGGNTDSGGGGSGGNADSGGGGSSGGGDAGTCKKDPTLHPTDGGTIFCGYQANDAGPLDCPTGKQCCLGGKQGTSFAPEQCATWGGGCDNPAPDGGLAIECNQNADCTANGMPGAACCLQGASAPALETGCTDYKAQGGTAVRCEASDAATPTCAAGDVQLCTSTADCPAGQTCTPMYWKLFQVGFCKQ